MYRNEGVCFWGKVKGINWKKIRQRNREGFLCLNLCVGDFARII